ncbi:hypothetical protein S7335_3241 [Synechococcus sp. PCC 7335]|uniref:endonuclease domain-containing protein n=1 Tax=Synechococcus sp. (strain ATCC 29403 / PCC 7335) TaxID=91464 RepID=UPI00017ED961|nr:DUF559 domain-containing protein [Synechococcus sp. PCC 7335]EDX85540.1 hypothetical protein S7335_3241 [Synechococcus sp. PCC 7335]
MSVDQQQTGFVNKLSLHQSRRNQSIPTLSTLVGGTAATHLLWVRWMRQTGRCTAVCTYESLPSLFCAWLSTAISYCDLQSLALTRTAQLAEREVEQLSKWLAYVGEYQKNQFWQHLTALFPQALWLRALISLGMNHPAKCMETLTLEGITLQEDDPTVVAQGFAVVSNLLPDTTIPGLLIHLPSGCSELFFRYSVLPALTRLVESVPAIPVGLLFSLSQSDELIEQLPESREKAVVRGGMVKLTTPKEEELRQWLGEHGLHQEDKIQPILHAARQYGATKEILIAAVGLAKTVSQNEPANSSGDIYRSHPERLLFQYLEARPATAGQFQVNAQVDITFGNRAMEVDFLADKAKVVIELDGSYHHLRSLDSYRRDRRKDFALQQEGFWVLRFLSEDVITHLEDILNAIDQALALRLAEAPVQMET